MRLEIVESLSVASGAENEDRAGAAGSLAWVIDGATDVLPQALTAGYSDAAWFAAAMNQALHEIAADAPPSLAALPGLIAQRTAPAFLGAARRPPDGHGDHPSAAGIVIRTSGSGAIDYVSLGDCVLMAETEDGLARIGIDERAAGDAWVVDALTAAAEKNERPLTRADLWPRLHAVRARMNTPGGYGIFSITAPPPSMVMHGSLRVPRDGRLLLASDGLTRLVDVFRRYDPAGLFAAAWERGLASLVQELRTLEEADRDCTRHPRAKVSDDTTGVLLRLKSAR
jgi:hypothetical protein